MRVQSVIHSAKFLALTLVAGAATGCGLVPSEYRGSFRDAQTNVSAEIGARKGTFRTADGRELKLKADRSDFERVASGKPGILVETNAHSGYLLDSFWVSPRMDTYAEGGGMAWFEAEVLYTQFDSRVKDPVRRLQFFHCVNGQVLLDTVEQRWQMGCPAGPAYYELRRQGD
ncbi:MAG: hypothetical protein IT285_08735 [Bdellovibrionales bacterium]|nr:hypothetical protein [Bdellovibrionales bacterium]